MDKKSKTVSMISSKKTEDQSNQPGKLSYEDLERVARDLSVQNRNLQNQLRSAREIINEFSDIDMLLGIIKQSENFSSDFILRCAGRVEKLVTMVLDNYDALDAGEVAGKEGNKF